MASCMIRKLNCANVDRVCCLKKYSDTKISKSYQCRETSESLPKCKKVWNKVRRTNSRFRPRFFWRSWQFQENKKNCKECLKFCENETNVIEGLSCHTQIQNVARQQMFCQFLDESFWKLSTFDAWTHFEFWFVPESNEEIFKTVEVYWDCLISLQN